jgi:hypothetical protein
MCFFGGGARAATPPKTTFDDSPPVVTGMQTGVDNPVDTAKVTEELKIKRMNKEGMSNPGDSLNIAGVTRKSGGLGAKEKSERSARLRSGVSRGPMKGGTKAQKAAKARRSKK